MRTIKRHYIFLPLVLLCSFYVYKAHFFKIHDFANYYFGAYFLGEGIFSVDIYFPYFFNKHIADLGYENIFVSYAPNTPFLSILFYPLTWISIEKAKLIFNVISTFLFVFSLVRLTRFFNIKKEYLLLLPVIFFIPIKNNLLFGQVYFLFFFFLSEGFLAYQKKRYKTMALFWSLAIFLKVFPILLGFFLLFRKEFKGLTYLVLSCILLLSISLSINGIAVWKFYIMDVLPRSGSGEIAGAFVDNYQSVYMLAKRLFVEDVLYNANALAHQPKLFYILINLFKVALLLIGYYITKNSKSALFSFSFWLVISLLISPYGSTYGFIVLIFMYLFISRWEKASFRHTQVKLLLFLSATMIFVPDLFPLNYLRLFALLFFVAIILVEFRDQIAFKKVGMIGLVVIVFSLFMKDKKIHSTYFLKEKMPLMTYDYALEKDTLTYFYWNENGENKKEIAFESTVNNEEVITIKNNQLFYKDKQLTFTKANKLKPLLLSTNEIIYLSDLNRGIGFYELRKIKLE